MCKRIEVNIPKNATKKLKLQSCQAGRKLVISTNLLPLFGLEYGTKIVEEIIAPGKGMKIRLANKEDKKKKKVYIREYKSRKNNPIQETLTDTRSQKILNEAFPLDTEYVHIIFKYGVIEIIPITNKINQSISTFKQLKNPLTASIACSSGIDGYSLKENRFQIDTLIEYRPHEKRDKTDLSETGAINALANLNINSLINEDIMSLDLDKIAKLTAMSTSTLFMISLQCDDFSNVKAKSLKDISLNDGTTTLDMVFDAISIVSKFMFPTVLVENVRGFATSDAAKMLKARLKRLGYKVTDEVLDARNFGGLTSRVRYYLVATLLPINFKMPKGTKCNITPIWDKYIEPYVQSGEARDVTNSKSLQDGLKTGRIRLIKRDSLFTPTLLKSQDRMAKDSVVIFDEQRDNKLFFPSREMMAELMGIPEQFNFNAVGQSLMSEIIGQSVEYPMHDILINEIKEHILTAHRRLNNKLF